ncbi:MAG TPA: 5-(carboxyamino)imidazole ribonucleotide synthase [Nitrososphaeraceae archaeon]
MKKSVFTSENPVRIGIIGGGQLGKMLCQEAKRMSMNVVILDPDPNCPAAKLCDDLIVSDFKNGSSLKSLASKSDLITYEIELTNTAVLRELGLKKHKINPSPESLYIIQNKYRQKTFMEKNMIPIPNFAFVNSKEDVIRNAKAYGFPVILKACEDGYDGRGNYLIRSHDDIDNALKYFAGRQCMLEEYVKFEKEISVMVARNMSGQIECFPVAENRHKQGILDRTIVPGRVSDKVKKRARKIACDIMNVFGTAGIFGIEMFVTADEKVLLNEIAPRPHNSGHYTIEAASISQFEQHLRAILNLPLSKPELLSSATMYNILGPEGFQGEYTLKGIKSLFAIPSVTLHLYGKPVTKPRRKLGHITALSSSLTQSIRRAEDASRTLKIVKAKFR